MSGERHGNPSTVYDIHLAYRDYRTALLAELQEAVLRDLRMRSRLEPKGAVGPDTLVIFGPSRHIPVACVRRETGWEYCLPGGGPTIAPATNLRAVLTWVQREAESSDE